MSKKNNKKKSRKLDKKTVLAFMKNSKKSKAKKQTLLDWFMKFVSNENLDFVEITTTDGNTTFDVATVAEGEPIIQITEDGEVPAPDGEYTVEYEGQNFTIVVENSVITSAAEASDDDDDDDSEEMTAEEMREAMAEFKSMLEEEEQNLKPQELMEMFQEFLTQDDEDEEEPTAEEQFMAMFNQVGTKKPNGKPAPKGKPMTKEDFIKAGMKPKLAQAYAIINR